MEETILFMNEKFGFKTKHGLKFKNINEISICEAVSNYTRITFKGNMEKILVSRSLKDIEELLPKKFFVRTHRSWLINIENIKEYVSSKNLILMQEDEIVPLSRNKKKVFFEAVDLNLRFRLS